MINPNIIYNVTGRYMDGQKLLAYHLVGDDGSQACETKERVIYLIGKGIIANMRIQSGTNGNVIIRGKGVNLNTLPVFDNGKNQFRSDGLSQAAENTQVPITKSAIPNINQMGQYRIIKRIMHKNRCLGYEVQDYSNSIKRFSREKVMELAIQKLVNNAVANKVTSKDENGQTKINVVLRGVGCDLNRLPILLADTKGNIIDPMKNMDSLSIRGASMKRSGIIKDMVRNKTIQFRTGDVVICEPSGNISVRNKLDVSKRYVAGSASDTAVCDDYLNASSGYSIEVFGSKPVQLNPNIVRSWAVLKPAKAVNN